MKTRTVKRHYCDHCRKASFQRPSMERHEAACFKNPNRKCPVCFDAPEHKPKYPFDTIACPDDLFLKIKARSGECPACLMAMVVRQREIGGGGLEYETYSEELRAFRDSKIDKNEQIKCITGIWTV